MPPVRTMSSIKPVKTERTHEENQERAYIAASRRSDRSLEARVESARRASEIHKRRTGRSLRVTEQDVVNEEMYEEEDDDLPMQYRRLTAHLATQNADFDRRLQSYLTQHVAMRTALGQAVTESWQHNQMPSNGFDMGNINNNNGQFMNPNFLQMQPSGFQNPMPSPNILNRTSGYRPAPYPLQNGQQGIRLNSHGRPASIAAPQGFAAYQQQQQQQQSYSHQQANQSQSALTSPVDSTVKPDGRRTSQPASSMTPQTPHAQPLAGSPAQRSSHALSRNNSSSNLATPQTFFMAPKNGSSPQQVPTPPQQMQPSYSSQYGLGFNEDTSPLTMMMPMNEQQLLTPVWDMNDPYGLLQGQAGMSNGKQDQQQQRFYSYNPNGKPKSSSPTSMTQPSFDGLNQTLLPSQLDTSLSAAEMFTSPTSVADDMFTNPQYSAPGYGFGLGLDSVFNMDQSQAGSSQHASGDATPVADSSFETWLDAEYFDDQGSTAQST